jgi:predicted dehydrogenase
MKSLNIAVVGVGNIGKRHAEHVKRLANLVAVCDIKKDRADAVASQFFCHVYYTIDDLLKNENDLDVVSICTPNGLHAEHSISALKAGHHVLCEKPMATSVRDCEHMIHAAETANRRLFIVKQNRFNPPVMAVKQAITEGRLGKICSVQLSCFWNRNNEYYQSSDWRGTLKLDGGTLFTQFSHFVDLLYWLIGDIEDVKVYTQNYLHEKIIEFEDTGVVAFRFSNGAIGTINYTVNSFGKNMEGSITIFGEKGTVKVGGQYLNALEYQSIEKYKIPDLPASNPPNQYGSYQGSMSNHDKVYENIIDVLVHGGKVTTADMLEGLKTVQIIERIYKEAKRPKERHG